MEESLIILFVLFAAGAYVAVTFLPMPWSKLTGAVLGIGALICAVKLLLSVV